MMNCISDELLVGNAPEDAIDLIDGLLDALGRFGVSPPPAIVNLSLSDDPEQDEWRCDLQLQLIPGVVLPTRCGCVELDEAPTNAEIVEIVVGDVTAVLPRISEIADVLHHARVDARKVLATWHDDGCQVRLIDVRLAPYDHWRGMDAPALELIVEGLGHHLEPAIMVVSVGSPSALATELQDIQSEQQILAATRRTMMSHGASGTIDQLAINAMKHAGRMLEDLQVLRREGRFWLQDETYVSLRRGHISAVSSDDDAHVRWTENGMAVRSTFVSGPLLAAAVGKPVSELYNHSYLTPDMIVEIASCTLDQGEFELRIRFRQSKQMFCMVTGRMWPSDKPVIGEQSEHGPHSMRPIAESPPQPSKSLPSAG